MSQPTPEKSQNKYTSKDSALQSDVLTDFKEMLPEERPNIVLDRLIPLGVTENHSASVSSFSPKITQYAYDFHPSNPEELFCASRAYMMLNCWDNHAVDNPEYKSGESAYLCAVPKDMPWPDRSERVRLILNVDIGDDNGLTDGLAGFEPDYWVRLDAELAAGNVSLDDNWFRTQPFRFDPRLFNDDNREALEASLQTFDEQLAAAMQDNSMDSNSPSVRVSGDIQPDSSRVAHGQINLSSPTL